MAWTVLAILTHPDTAEAVLQNARSLADRVGGQVTAMHVRHDAAEGFMPTEEVMTPERQQGFDAEEQRRSDAVKAVFDRWAANSGLAGAPEWQEVTGPIAKAVKARAADAELIAVGHAAHPHDPEAAEALRALLFEARVPTLIASGRPATVGRHPAIAWKPGAPAEAAIRSALPVLEAAERVTLLIGDAEDDGSAAPGFLVEALKAHGVALDVRRFESAGRAIGDALTEEARQCGADLLVMGAFAHSRLRERILGGATQEVLQRADLPVLMRH